MSYVYSGFYQFVSQMFVAIMFFPSFSHMYSLHVYAATDAEVEAGTFRMNAAGDHLIKSALLHQTAARAVQSQPNSAFLLSPDCPTQSKFASVASISSKKGKGVLIDQIKSRLHTNVGPPGERESTRVFTSQDPKQPTVSAFTADFFKDATADPLPGGVPLVDHLAAWLSTASDWSEMSPHIESLRSSRLPTPKDILNSREVTLGISTPEEWSDALKFVKNSMSKESSSIIPFIAADTESIPIHATWHLLEAESTFEGLLYQITIDGSTGYQTTTFDIASQGQSACGLPTRFFIGGLGWQLHIRLPISHSTEDGVRKVTLLLNTTLCDEVEILFLALDPLLGSGITSDLFEWSQIINTIWSTTMIEKMAKPVELEQLVRIARINTANSSIFHINWWSFGTVLPKKFGSLGDGKWGMPLKELPSSLRQYLTADIAQTVKLGSLLVIIWVAQTFPDMTIIKASSPFNAVSFTQWAIKKIFCPLLPGWREIKTGPDGAWAGVVPQATWEPQPDVRSLVLRMNPPSLQEFELLWFQPEWPAITSGGPRYLHEVRSAFLERLPLLTKLDPVSWIIHHEDKKLFWRFGHPKELSSRSSSAPVSCLGLVANPGLETKLPLDPMAWSPAIFRPLLVPQLRGERVLIVEFMRLHPGQAKKVLELAENQKAKFKSIVGPKRVLKLVHDIRTMLEDLNMELPRPTSWSDPFKIEDLVQKKVEKAMKHLQFKLVHYVTHQQHYAEKIAMAEQALKTIGSGQDGARFTNNSLLRMATATTGVAMRGKIKKTSCSIEKLGTAKDELQPARRIIVRDESVDQKEQDDSRLVKILDSPEAMVVEEPELSPPALPRSFTTEMKELVRTTLLAGDNYVVRGVLGSQVKGADIQSLVGEEWLNDSVIEAYLQMIVSRSGKNGLPSIHTFLTFFYPKLAARGYKEVSDWSRKSDIFAFDLVFIPVFTSSHWSIIIVDMGRLSITHYDSKFNSLRSEVCLKNIQNYLKSEYESKKSCHLGIEFSTSALSWIPQQKNNVDCGVFMCQFAEHVSRGASFTFSQQNIPLARQLMVWEIATNTLIGDGMMHLPSEEPMDM